MHPCSLLLDQSFILLECEWRALDTEQDGLMDFFAELRVEILHEAWQARDGYDEQKLKERLGAMWLAQEELREMVEFWRNSMGEQLQNNKRYSKYFAGSKAGASHESRMYRSLARS